MQKRTQATYEKRLLERVDRSDPEGCWPWTRYLQRGYGIIQRPDGKRVPAHRAVYELLVGPIPDGLTLDHLCRNPPCCNPDHLEPVTQAENNRRGVGWAGENARKTHCKRGHEFTPENTYTYRGMRSCRLCARIKAKRYRERHGL